MIKPSPEAIKLFEALSSRGITSRLEKVSPIIDLTIERAKLDIEISDSRHFTDSEQMQKDLERNYWSKREGYEKIHIPRRVIEEHLDKVADSLAKVAKDRMSIPVAKDRMGIPEKKETPGDDINFKRDYGDTVAYDYDP
ncbi:MAG: hypothetical protein ABIJ92_03320 [Candidatus Aenigmatarchaeota archaeon]